jgi:hypothetical protein
MKTNHVKIYFEMETFSCAIIYNVLIKLVVKFQVFFKKKDVQNDFFNIVTNFNTPFVTPIDISFLRFLKLTCHGSNKLLFVIYFGVLIPIFHKYIIISNLKS